MQSHTLCFIGKTLGLHFSELGMWHNCSAHLLKTLFMKNKDCFNVLCICMWRKDLSEELDPYMLSAMGSSSVFCPLHLLVDGRTICLDVEVVERFPYSHHSH